MSHITCKQRFFLVKKMKLHCASNIILITDTIIYATAIFHHPFLFTVMIHLFKAIGFTIFWLINARIAFHLEPVKHVVMFSFRQDVTRSDIKKVEQALLSLPNKIPQIQDYELGRDMKLIAGQIHPAGKNRAIYWSASFSCVSDYRRYDRHPAHVAFLKTLKPLILPGSRAAIQYRIKK